MGFSLLEVQKPQISNHKYQTTNIKQFPMTEIQNPKQKNNRSHCANSCVAR